ncbi:hypothetical protein SPAN111604_00460 [Sphingomonas antarctica]|uniref:DUF5063 domain-containing protein n=1 Tax=Sphingomonas antarctica TaxID=2040274 RepID=UPI0039E7AB80
MFEAAKAFLTEVREGEPPSIRRLLELLDALSAAYHALPISEPFDTDDDIVAKRDWSESIKFLGRRFPNLGYYPVVDPLADITTEVSLGDAIDDLADIERDLEEYLERLAKFGPNDANWHVRFSYEIHWGWHLRELAAYLHAKEWRS